ncbi:MAG: hypothetical protein ACXW6J_21725 [Candidatus Binatia bacterium]
MAIIVAGPGKQNDSNIMANKFVISSLSILRVPYDRAPDFFYSRQVFDKGQIIYFSDAFSANDDTPIDNTLGERVVGNLFVLGESAMLANGCLGVFQGEDAE